LPERLVGEVVGPDEDLDVDSLQGTAAGQFRGGHQGLPGHRPLLGERFEHDAVLFADSFGVFGRVEDLVLRQFPADALR
jgi:hypothetical protein